MRTTIINRVNTKTVKKSVYNVHGALRICKNYWHLRLTLYTLCL